MESKKGRTGSFKGVCFHKSSKMWRVTLKHNKVTYLNCYVKDEREGAKMRDLAIIRNCLDIPLQVLKKVS